MTGISSIVAASFSVNACGIMKADASFRCIEILSFILLTNNQLIEYECVQLPV